MLGIAREVMMVSEQEIALEVLNEALSGSNPREIILPITRMVHRMIGQDSRFSIDDASRALTLLASEALRVRHELQQRQKGRF
jgi:hypothetical protein